MVDPELMSWVRGGKYSAGSASIAVRLGINRGTVRRGELEGCPFSKRRVINARDGLCRKWRMRGRRWRIAGMDPPITQGAGWISDRGAGGSQGAEHFVTRSR